MSADNKLYGFSENMFKKNVVYGVFLFYYYVERYYCICVKLILICYIKFWLFDIMILGKFII